MCDRVRERQVSTEEGELLGRKLGCMFLEASAATTTNVQEAFVALVRTIRRLRQTQSGVPGLQRHLDGAVSHQAMSYFRAPQSQQSCGDSSHDERGRHGGVLANLMGFFRSLCMPAWQPKLELMEVHHGRLVASPVGKSTVSMSRSC